MPRRKPLQPGTCHVCLRSIKTFVALRCGKPIRCVRTHRLRKGDNHQCPGSGLACVEATPEVKNVKLYLAHFDHMGSKHSVHAIGAQTHFQAAQLLVQVYAKGVGTLTHRSEDRPYTVYVDEFCWDGQVGFKTATDTNGDRRYDAYWSPQKNCWIVRYSEKSFA